MHILDLNPPGLLSVPEHFDLLCRTDREVALRAAARYCCSIDVSMYRCMHIDLLLHHLVNVLYVCTHGRRHGATVRWQGSVTLATAPGF